MKVFNNLSLVPKIFKFIVRNLKKQKTISNKWSTEQKQDPSEYRYALDRTLAEGLKSEFTADGKQNTQRLQSEFLT